MFLSSKFYFSFIVIGYFLASFVLIGCDNKTDNTTQESPKQEFFSFNNPSSHKNIELNIKQDTLQFPKQQAQEITNLFSSDSIKLLVFFPKDCVICQPLLAHINNLGSRFNNLHIIILSQENVDIKTYKDFLFSSHLFFDNFVATNQSFTLFLNALQSNLNFNLKSSQSPLFLLINQHNQVIKSYEGAILEEILEIDINEVLKNKTQPTQTK